MEASLLYISMGISLLVTSILFRISHEEKREIVIIETTEYIIDLSVVTDSKIISNNKVESDTAYKIRIKYENEIVITNKFQEGYHECLIEGPDEVIKPKIKEYTKVCFSELGVNAQDNLVASLLEDGNYESDIDGTSWYAEYRTGSLLFRME